MGQRGRGEGGVDTRCRCAARIDTPPIWEDTRECEYAYEYRVTKASLQLPYDVGALCDSRDER